MKQCGINLSNIVPLDINRILKLVKILMDRLFKIRLLFNCLLMEKAFKSFLKKIMFIVNL
jgi:hypothetical protein